MTYQEYLEARNIIWQQLPSRLKEQINVTKEQLEHRYQIMLNEKRLPKNMQQIGRTPAWEYNKKYEELCKLEEQAGLTEIAKNFCEAQARKMRR